METTTLIWTRGDQSITNSFKIVVQHPTSLSTISQDSEPNANGPNLKVRYQILDQNGQPLRCVVTVGSAKVRLAALKASEVLAWQCSTFCSGAQGDSHDVSVADDGTFSDLQSAPTLCINYVRSQVAYVGMLNYPSQDVVAYKCICFSGSEFKILAGTATGAACCNTCGQ
jgi:hypothetical protein